MNRTTSLLIAASVLVLGGAWLASRALTADIAAPPVAAVTAPPVVAPAPVVNPSPPAPGPEAAVVAPPPVPYVPPARPPEPPPPRPEDGKTEQELESAAIAEQAWKVINAPETGPANWMRAAKEFKRCLFMTPDNERCKSGLEAAQKRIGEAIPTAGPKVRAPHPASTDEE